jgi:hypothetical protein
VGGNAVIGLSFHNRVVIQMAGCLQNVMPSVRVIHACCTAWSIAKVSVDAQHCQCSTTTAEHRLSHAEGAVHLAVAACSKYMCASHTRPAGALVAGPALDGSYADNRTLSSQSAVGLHHNVPLIGLLGGILSTGVTSGRCAAGHGLFQLFTVQDLP